ncbi:MAG TPA: LuxR C-terminal-related transcriptional regulator [Ferruginibacter sp.]|jgi:DNA-binding CsgD family transcriptional regulator|nr:LuxR C-terminal-related transcriptional regulator [Ferruginibacter sp.]
MELTKQEKKMLIALSSGKLYKEIATDNYISINTVKKHLKNVYKKMNVKSRSEATEKYSQQSLPHNN